MCTNGPRWDPARRFPVEFHERVLAPGTERTTEELLVSVSELSAGAAAEAIAWVPAPGERVQDRRNLYAVDYRITADGRLPANAWVASEAEALGARIGELRSSQIVGAVPAPAAEEAGAAGLPGRTGPRLEIQPALCDLGRQPFGSSHPVEFRVTNRGDEEAYLGPVQADCGCLEARLDVPVLAPGQVAVLSARQTVQNLGPQSYALRIPVLNAPASQAEARVSVEGLAASVLLPARMYLGAGASLPVRAVFLPAAAVRGAVPACTVRGELTGTLQISPGPDGSWTITGTVEPSATAPLGAIEGELVVRSADGEGAACRLLAERAPPLDERWPSCRLILPAYAPREASLVLPGTVIDRWRIGPLGHADGIEFSIERGQDGDALVARADSATAPATIRGLDVELETSRGPVRVHLTIPTAARERR